MIQYRLKGKIFRLLSLKTQFSKDSNFRELLKKTISKDFHHQDSFFFSFQEKEKIVFD
jgi:hypothetical protein